jgi:hypothetical protein
VQAVGANTERFRACSGRQLRSALQTSARDIRAAVLGEKVSIKSTLNKHEAVAIQRQRTRHADHQLLYAILEPLRLPASLECSIVVGWE